MTVRMWCTAFRTYFALSIRRRRRLYVRMEAMIQRNDSPELDEFFGIRNSFT